MVLFLLIGCVLGSATCLIGCDCSQKGDQILRVAARPAALSRRARAWTGWYAGSMAAAVWRTYTRTYSAPIYATGTRWWWLLHLLSPIPNRPPLHQSGTLAGGGVLEGGEHDGVGHPYHTTPGRGCQELFFNGNW